MQLLAHPQILNPRAEMKILLAGFPKMKDLAVSRADRVYSDCFLAIATMRLSEDWMQRYAILQAEIGGVRRRPERKSPAVNAEMLDLTLVIIDLLDQNPGDAFWPETKLLTILRISAERRGGLEAMRASLGV